MEWIYLAQDSDSLRVFVKAVMDILIYSVFRVLLIISVIYKNPKNALPIFMIYFIRKFLTNMFRPSMLGDIITIILRYKCG